MKKRFLGIVPFILTMVSGCQSSSRIVNLYTDRHYAVDQALYDDFFAETGIQVNVVKLDADPLLTRLETEGSATAADLIFLADAGRLGRAKQAGLLKAFPASEAFAVVPEYLQDEDQHWIGLTKRARILVYDPLRVDVSELSDYENLALPQWQGSIAVRSSSHVYNQSLVAAMLALLSEQAVENWLTGLVSNFAIRDPLTGSKHPVGNDRDQAKAVANGLAKVAIMNSYYYGRMLHSEEVSEREVAESLAIFFPNQATYGTHINVSGMGLTRHAKRSPEALALVEYLLSENAQRVFADANFEYPIRSDVTPHPLLTSWGTFKEQNLPLSQLYLHSQKAFQMMNEAGWR